MADGLALADGVANGGAVADGVALEGDGGDLAGEAGDALRDGDGDELLDEEAGDVGVLWPLEEQSESEDLFSNLDFSLCPATLSQSMDLFRSRTTFALMWKDPEAKPS